MSITGLKGGCHLASRNVFTSNALRARRVRTLVSRTTDRNNKIVMMPSNICVANKLRFGRNARLRLRGKTILVNSSFVNSCPLKAAHVRKRAYVCFNTLVGISGGSKFAVANRNAVSNGNLGCRRRF